MSCNLGYMPKRRDGAAREAARRARPGPAWDGQLADVRARLVRLEATRAGLLAERSALVQQGRSAGATWPTIERLTGVSRPALLKRPHTD